MRLCFGKTYAFSNSTALFRKIRIKAKRLFSVVQQKVFRKPKYCSNLDHRW